METNPVGTEPFIFFGRKYTCKHYFGKGLWIEFKKGLLLNPNNEKAIAIWNSVADCRNLVAFANGHGASERHDCTCLSGKHWHLIVTLVDGYIPVIIGSKALMREKQKSLRHRKLRYMFDDISWMKKNWYRPGLHPNDNTTWETANIGLVSSVDRAPARQSRSSNPALTISEQLTVPALHVVLSLLYDL